MRRSILRLAGATAIALFAAVVSPAFSEPPEIVKGVDLVSAQKLPTELVRAAIGELADRPRSRAAIRESLERLWSLGLFSEVWVDETQESDGIRLRFHLTRSLQIRRSIWSRPPAFPSGAMPGRTGWTRRGRVCWPPMSAEVSLPLGWRSRRKTMPRPAPGM